VKKPVVLCVDDARTVLNSLKKELREALGDAYTIELAEGGEDALETFNELIADGYEVPLVISDYIMPDIKGDELLARIHEFAPDTLKIMLTGLANTEAVGNAVNQAKLYRYISKPWESEDLKLTVKEAVRSYEQEKQLKAQNIKLQNMNQELAELNKAYERFVPKQFLKLLNKDSVIDVELGTHIDKEMSVLFADIRDFTRLSENMTPQENFDFINTYLSRMEPIIDVHQGFVDKYIGDAIMALFPSTADSAVHAAIGMLEALAGYNLQRIEDCEEPIRIGVGVNTGALMLGTVGGKNRMDGTVISDTVNLASRVESLTKGYKVDLLITEQTYLELSDPLAYQIRIIDNVQVKGKSHKVTIYEVFDADDPDSIALKNQTIDDFNFGVQSYHERDYTSAKSSFETVLSINPTDHVAQIYLTRCQYIP
jgi:class 3 adenylate cyclase